MPGKDRRRQRRNAPGIGDIGAVITQPKHGAWQIAEVAAATKRQCRRCKARADLIGQQLMQTMCLIVSGLAEHMEDRGHRLNVAELLENPKPQVPKSQSNPTPQ